ncbi:hypothetical protein BC831DRAFT_488057 [Entophlyctis helioformis]|nr:hypothetical protein BC831DRAFT_488057 [Entophlyctis helioformis]
MAASWLRHGFNDPCRPSLPRPSLIGLLCISSLLSGSAAEPVRLSTIKATLPEVCTVNRLKEQRQTQAACDV